MPRVRRKARHGNLAVSAASNATRRLRSKQIRPICRKHRLDFDVDQRRWGRHQGRRHAGLS